MNKQEFLDQTFQKLIAQGKPGFDLARGVCVYRTKDGAGCAIGVWMGPVYKPEFDRNMRVERVLTNMGWARNLGLPCDDYGWHFVIRCQAAHDHAAWASQNMVWEEILREEFNRVAMEYHLTPV